MRRFPGQSGQPGKQGPVRVSEVPSYEPAPQPAQLPEPELRTRITEPIPVTRVREPATRSEIVYVVLPEQQKQEPVAPSIVNVTVTPPTQPERSQDELRREPSSTHPRDQGERKTDSGKPQSEVRQPAAPDAEKVYQYIPPQERKFAPPEERKPEESEVPKAAKAEVKPESQLEVPIQQKPTHVERKPEEKSSEPESKSEEKSSSKKTKKLKIYNGLGRRHTAAEIDEILDCYIMEGQLPPYVSDRQRYSYKHHVKLPERRQLLEQAGLIEPASGTKKRGSNVVPISGRGKTQRQKRASGDV